MRGMIVGCLALAAGCAASAPAQVGRDLEALLGRGQVDEAAALWRKQGRGDGRLLARIAEAVVERGLRDRDPAVRTRAAEVLLAAASPRLDPLLPPLLDDPAPRVRVEAAATLASVLPEARRKAEALLANADPAVRARAVEAIEALEDPAAWASRLAADDVPSVRVALVRQLGAWKGRGARLAGFARGTAAAMLLDRDPRVRAAAVRALRGSGGLEPAELDRALLDADPGVKLAAAESLLAAAPPPRLLALASGDDLSLALRAAVRLDRIGRVDAALAVVERAAGAREASVREAAMVAAIQLGEHAVPLAQRVLQGERDLDVRLQAARVLAHGGRPTDAAELFSAALSGPRALDAADELARLGDARGYTVLERVARSPSADRRLGAIALLAPLPRALPTLAAALSDPSPPVRLTAASAILRRHYRPYLPH